ncbi:unnamed protein product [Vitrella brassicaformis CCMP3155]|uniref:Uncharacterized protein n=1 Tax=Vitrella brassicaformis (strain CCMP3155) TaxID=1169540 RepID=A0A0G4GSV2_VITBC|nr:unnamed protein product [Vitrella brassicaformis CCMP3155]|eukprot:CEM33779.1 unnamed protein product [Vitrella brassicaformis CCMP3155]
MAAPDMLLASLLSGNRRIFTPGQDPAMPLFNDYAQSWFNFQRHKESARDVRRRHLQGVLIIGAGAQLAGQMAGAISAGQGSKWDSRRIRLQHWSAHSSPRMEPHHKVV